jgi:hypothetical protein
MDGERGVWGFKFFWILIIVSNVFPKIVPNSTTILSHKYCPKLNVGGYKSSKPKGINHLGMLRSQTSFVVMGQSK